MFVSAARSNTKNTTRVAEYDDERSIDTVRNVFGDLPSGLIDSLGNDDVFQLPQAQMSAGEAPEGLLNSFCSILRFQGLDVAKALAVLLAIPV